MAGEWSQKQFGDCAVLARETVSPADSAGAPYIGLEHIAEGALSLLGIGTADDVTSIKSRFRAGDILFGKLRPYFRKVIRAPFDGVCSTDIWVVRPRDNMDAGFVFYWMASQDFVDASMRGSEGTKMPRAKWDFVARISRPVPPLPEQRAIAHILGTLDDKIELNRRMNETLEAMARALFKSWFVDFEPVRAKAEGRDTSLPPHLAELFPSRLVDSELGEVPEGWRVKAIGDVAERVAMGPFGSSIKVETFVPEGVPIISGQHLHGFILEDNTFNFITREHAKKLANAIVQRGDVVFTHAGNIGQAAFIPKTSRFDRYVISQRQFYMRCDLSQVTPTFIALYFNSPEGRHQLLANTSSSGVPSIARPVTYLRSIQLPIPRKTVLDAFDRLLSPILLRFRQNMDMNRTLAAARDALLHKLISGEIRVKDAERFVARST